MHGKAARDTGNDHRPTCRTAEPWGVQQSTTSGLRVGCAPHLGAQKLQAFLGACYAQAPELDVEVFHLPSDMQRRRLRRAELDVGLFDASAACDGDPDIEMQPLFPGDPLAVFLPVHHPLAERERLEPRALLGRVLLMRPAASDPDFHELLMSRIAGAGYRFADVRERGGDDPRDLLFAVAEGRGITIGPLSLHTAAGDIGTLVTARPLDPPQTMPDTLLAWQTEPPAHRRDTLALVRALTARLRDDATVPAMSRPPI
ncbi:MAG: LysR family transcriptional regulator, hydrogen peroxide-inducible s activator [Solirubrobacteraceae bacterium]|nr:LysR family transcriptional regulator, hydrogen peroxide-inducible s activator [Solirubrobacteraceae bacterium]